MSSPMIVVGKRRFTCLSPRLVRMEFSPSEVFEDRRSLVAYHPRQPQPFDQVTYQDQQVSLSIGNLVIYSRQNELDFFPSNLRVDWKSANCTHSWYFGDRDYRNLGGTVRSLDYYGRDCLLNGVHPASLDSPDDYFHVDAELLHINQVYLQDGHLDWQMDILRQGLYGALKYTPHKVYNRYMNMAGDLTRYQPGLLSRNGYFVLNDSTGALLDEDDFPVERSTAGTRDLYFFAYGNDYKAALQDYRLLSGSAPLPSRNIFGIIFSRWPAFDAVEAQELVLRFREAGIPLSILALDLEWHVPDFAHWDWNPATFPDPSGFMHWAHSQGIQVMLNVHPQYIPSTDSHFDPYIKSSGTASKVQSIWANPLMAMTIKSGADRMIEPDLGKKQEATAIKDICCAPVLEQGVDFWWLDGPSATLNGADGQLLSSKVFYETTERQNRRGMLQARYGGLGSHRYGMFFTGDTQSQWEVLQSECEFNIRAGQVGMAYVTHDIGGFSHAVAPIIDPDLYIRWLQFGVFSPVLRFHSAPGAGSRQPWDYGKHNLEIALRWIKYRNSLMPYLYTFARQGYETGLPLVRGIYLEYPEDENAYIFDEYFLGDCMLVAPVLTPANHRLVYLPAGNWYELESGKIFTGNQHIPVFAGLEQVPVYIKAGSILLRQGDTTRPGAAFVDDLLIDVYPGENGQAWLYEDDNQTREYQQGGYCLTRFELLNERSNLSLVASRCEGKPFGQERQVKVQIILPAIPGAVSLNEQELPAALLHYDSSTRQLLVDLGRQPVQSSWKLVITQDN